MFIHKFTRQILNGSDSNFFLLVHAGKSGNADVGAIKTSRDKGTHSKFCPVLLRLYAVPCYFITISDRAFYLQNPVKMMRAKPFLGGFAPRPPMIIPTEGIIRIRRYTPNLRD